MSLRPNKLVRKKVERVKGASVVGRLAESFDRPFVADPFDADFFE